MKIKKKKRGSGLWESNSGPPDNTTVDKQLQSEALTNWAKSGNNIYVTLYNILYIIYYYYNYIILY